MNFNKLLEDQISKFLGKDFVADSKLTDFIMEVNNSYELYQKKITKSLPDSENSVDYFINNLVNDTITNDDGKVAPTIIKDNNLKEILDDYADINQQKIKIEKELENSAHNLLSTANRLSYLTNFISNGILLEDENRNIVLANQLFCDMFKIEVEPELLPGVDCNKLFKKSTYLFKNPEEFGIRIDELLKNKIKVVGEELILKDGRILKIDFVPIYVESEYNGQLWKFSDVTTGNEIKQELKRLSMVASANENGVLFCNAAGIVSWINESFSKLTGYSMQDVIGKKAVELCIGPLTDLSTIKLMLDAFYAGKVFNLEIIHYRKNGSWFWGRIKGQPIFDDKGIVQQYYSMTEDITSEKENAEQLKILSLIAQENMNAVIISDAEDKITWVNKSFVNITGYTLADVTGKNASILRGPDTNLETVEYIKNSIAEGKSIYCEILNYSKTGSEFWLKLQVQCILDSNGKITGHFSLLEDITKQKEDQAKIKEYDTRFRNAFEKIGDNVWEHDFTTGKTYFSKTKNHLLGYTDNENIDTAALWWDSVYEDDKDLLIQNDKKYKSGLIDHHILEYRIVQKDGTIRWVMDRGVIIELTKDYKPLKIIGTHTDITDRKQAEELLKRAEQKYRSIIANMNLGLLEVDILDNIVFANQSFCDMSGYKSDELIGKNASESFFTENKELINRKNSSRKMGKSDAYEIKIKNKEGQHRWWLISGAPRYNEAGELLGTIGIHLDITAQKQLETDLIEAREQAESSTRSKEDFLANMSHEIRTPMNAILGMTHQLTKTNLNSTQLFFLDTINSASENLMVIINDILDLSKIEAGKLNLENIGFQPKIIIENAMHVFKHKAAEKGILINSLNYDNTLSSVLMGDPYRLNQILLNLISNALKFTEIGSISLSCAVLNDTDLSQKIQIKVADTGIGMEEIFVNNLFEKFSQEDISVTRQYGGTGLGMSICKDLVALMGGVIVAKSKKGQGTTITFEVTFAKGNVSDLPVKKIININKEVIIGKKILVVDDNKINRLVAKTILLNYGAVITEAVNGKDAIDQLKEGDYDIVLMDIQMPVMGGMEATRIIRNQISESLPIIALTANAIKGDNEKCIAGGMDGYLSKPFKEEELLQIVSVWVGGKIESLADNKSISPKKKLYDLSVLYEIGNGSEVFVMEILNLFISETPVQLSNMQRMYAAGDYKGIAAVLHQLKPGIENLGITSLKENIIKIEEIIYTDIPDSAIKQLLTALIQHLKDVILELKQDYVL